MVKEGIPFVLVPGALIILFAVFQWWIPAVIFLLICGFMAYFFRDPARVIPTEPNIIVSAADGRVTRIDDTDAGIVVSVFLSPLDVHINRSPITARIANIEYVKGKKMPATSDNASFVNERNSLFLEADGLNVKCTQIAGIVARRIVCWPSTGDKLERGQKFGLIKFSSRTDLLMPRDVKIEVKVGDRVRGGETVIARVI
ncbi:MAG: phosphatidylserine decarboxylase [Pyrinomonadaceae bacterium]|nr:phosphatidylserine decarboxylase [Pyrinomonadaceae bacterium]MBP6214016.1 phosphatidylserine decarboxylase [Pyrinomonadaceae bacterium]